MTRELPGDRFRRVAERRVIRTIREIRLIGNLSNRSNYLYNREDVEKIFRALERELKSARVRFEQETDSRSIEFSL
jgi:hypothetical protein